MNIIEQFKLTGKVALVTGASRGLGRAIAVGLAQAGAKVAAVSRNMELTEETANEIRRQGGEAIALKADVKSESDVKSMVAAVLKKFGRIDILVIGQMQEDRFIICHSERSEESIFKDRSFATLRMTCDWLPLAFSPLPLNRQGTMRSRTVP